jgi:hypothetical protein
MNSPSITIYRLSPRGGGGLACDKAGVALGPTDLVRIGAHVAGRRRYETRSPQALGCILSTAYGAQPEGVILRLHRGLRRAASAIEAGDLCLAGIETVLLALPDLTPSALAKLARGAELEKGGTAWENQPRVPAGQSDGGQWTADGGSAGAPTFDAQSAARTSPHAPTSSSELAFPIDDGVYRPETDAPRITLTAGPEEETESRGSNGPPPDITTLEEVFPRLRDAPASAVPLTPIDHFLGLRVRLGIQGWAFRRSRLPPMATRIMASETSIRVS